MDRSVAYASYVLAKAGRMDKARLRYLHDDRLGRIESPLAKAQIGAALYMIGDNARAKSAFDQAEAAIGYVNTGDYYQTTRRDLAGVLALAQEARQTDRVRRLSQRVAQDLPEPDRLTTQEKAFLLLAANALSGGQAAVNVAVQGQANAVSSGVYKMGDAQMRTPPSFTNRGQGQVWVTSIARGSPASAPGAGCGWRTGNQAAVDPGRRCDRRNQLPSGRPPHRGDHGGRVGEPDDAAGGGGSSSRRVRNRSCAAAGRCGRQRALSLPRQARLAEHRGGAG